MSKLQIGRYTFDLASKLPEYSRPWADAYAADSHPEHPAGIYALLLSHRMPPRIEMFNGLENTKTGPLQDAFDYDVVSTPMGQKLGFILELPPGPLLAKDLRQPFQHYKEEILRNNLIAPIHAALVGLHDRPLFHGAISPLNIYAGAGLQHLMLGEAITQPPGYFQPALFESIERAECRPEGKGESTTEDDLFALGVTTYLMALGNNPFAKLSDEELVRARLEVGSSTLMLNFAKLPATILELVRGLCSDNPKQRWNLNELDNWLGGARVAPRNVTHVAKATRALEFNGKEYNRARMLAAALHENPAETRKLVDGKEILRWLNRSLGDLPLYEEAHRVIEKTDIKSVNDDMLAARIAMVLDPQGPIRYKSIQVMPAAIGTYLAHAFMTQNVEAQKMIAEIISSDLLSHWISLPANGGPFLQALAKEIDRTRDYLTIAGMSNGLERVLYELQLHAPCYSEYFANQYVLTPKQGLPALNDLATGSRRPTEPLDRHMSAFFSARMGRGKETVFGGAQTQKNEAAKSLATLDLLAHAQNRFGIGPVPKLAAWLLDNLRPALERFHNRTLRQALQQSLTKLAAQGELDALLRAVDSPQIVEGDLRGFHDAVRQFRYLTNQINEVDNMLENKFAVGQAVGQRVAAGLALLIGMVGVAAALTVAVR